MSKEVIAVDVDEVLFPFLDEFITYHDNKYGSRLHKDLFYTYDFDQPLGLPQAETTKRVYEFLDYIDEIPVDPLETACSSIAKLATKYDLAIVTARHSQFERLTANWLSEHFPAIFKQVRAIGYAAIIEQPLTKAAVCQELKAIALIDDSITHVTQCADAGIEGILFGDYPWNRIPIVKPGVFKCENWNKVVEHFNA
ncbi:MAG: hypothetical protein NVS1B7_4780 [Candidatus Saccharimonadales bacterium]